MKPLLLWPSPYLPNLWLIELQWYLRYMKNDSCGVCVAVVGLAMVAVGHALNKLRDLLFWWWKLHFLDMQLMDLHWTSCGICPYLPNHWLILRRMIVVEHAGIKISYWVSSSKPLVDKRRFWQNGPASQHVRNEPTKHEFLVDFCFELTAWNPFSSDLPLSPKSLIDKEG